MNDNTEMANNGTELYINKLFELADEYINKRLEGDESKISENFRDMIFYASDRMEKPSNDDIVALENLFDAYVRLCVRYHRMPTIECFSFLTKINDATFRDWKNQVYRSSDARYGTAVKRWFGVCKNFVVDELNNSKGANVNLIFVAKSAYGLRESSPPVLPETDIRRVLTADQLPRLSGTPEEIAASYGQIRENNEVFGLPEVPE